MKTWVKHAQRAAPSPASPVMELHITRPFRKAGVRQAGEEIKFSPRFALLANGGSWRGVGYFTEYGSTVRLRESFRSGGCHHVVIFDGAA